MEIETKDSKNQKMKYFTKKEVQGLDSKLVSMLDKTRGIAEIPFHITSGLADRGGTSAHNKGLAVDLRAHDSRSRFLIISAAIAVGFTRIGVYDLHVHLDIDESKDQRVTWIGISK